MVSLLGAKEKSGQVRVHPWHQSTSGESETFAAQLDGRHAEMLADELTEERGVGKAELVAYLLDAQVGGLQIVAYVLQHVLLYPLVGGPSGVVLADG